MLGGAWEASRWWHPVSVRTGRRQGSGKRVPSGECVTHLAPDLKGRLWKGGACLANAGAKDGKDALLRNGVCSLLGQSVNLAQLRFRPFLTDPG